MKNATFFLLLILFFMPSEINAGLIATSQNTQIAPSEFRALIVFDGKEETIFNSFTFNANPVTLENFVWIVPVPSEPKVERLKKDIFLELDAYTEKKFEKNNIIDRILYFDIYEEKNISPQSFSRPVDFIQYKTFGGENALSDLIVWIESFGYYVPKTAKSKLEDYHKEKWHFVAMEVNALHLEYDARDSLMLEGAHTFPIKITFPTDKIIYPIKLASVQPDSDTVNLPYSFDYGRKSEDLLGESNEQVDQVLAYQSENTYPRIPLSYFYNKLEFYVLSKGRVTSDGFTTTFADSVNTTHLNLEDLLASNTNYFMTKVYSFRPQMMLDDLEFSEENLIRVNPEVSTLEKIGRIVLLLGAMTLIVLTVRGLIKRCKTKIDH